MWTSTSVSIWNTCYINKLPNNYLLHNQFLSRVLGNFSSNPIIMLWSLRRETEENWTAITDTIKVCVKEAVEVVCTQNLERKKLICVIFICVPHTHSFDRSLFFCFLFFVCDEQHNRYPKEGARFQIRLRAFQHMHDEWKDNVIYSHSCVPVRCKAIHPCVALLHGTQTPFELNSSAALVLCC